MKVVFRYILRAIACPASLQTYEYTMLDHRVIIVTMYLVTFYDVMTLSELYTGYNGYNYETIIL